MFSGKRAIVGVAVAAATLVAAGPASASGRVVAVDGVAKGRSDLRVEILVHVKAGQSARAAAARALEAQGAKPAPEPPQSAGFTLTGLRWETLPVVQHYNPAGQPAGLAASAALSNTYGPWSSVSGSIYRIQGGATTNRCPSLVRGCRGGAVYDGNNDVGWARLSGGTLGVTWYSTSVDEADMAINTRYTWNTGCRSVSGSYDLQTVYLHENGHVAGLGHSTNTSAVMYPSYRGVRCALAADDRNGLAELY